MLLTIDRRDELDEGLPGSDTDTTRLWVSEQQWLSILERLKRGDDAPKLSDKSAGASDATGARHHARRAAGYRCLLRLAAPSNHEADHGTFLVRSRNLSPGGMAFAHDTELHSGTRCTVGLQRPVGEGLIVPGRVAWCRQIDRTGEDSRTHHVGVQFDRPIDLSDGPAAA